MISRFAPALACLLLAIPAHADRTYRISRDDQTVGMLHEAAEIEGRLAGRRVRIRVTRIELVASYVGTRELHTFREWCQIDEQTGKVVSFRAEYRQGRREENRHLRFVGRRAILQIVPRDGSPEERAIELPEGAFLATGPQAVAESILTGTLPIERPFPVVDPRTLEIEARVLSPPTTETVEIAGEAIACRIQTLRVGERSTTYWISRETDEVVRFREEGAVPTLFEQTDASIDEEIEGLDVAAPPLSFRRDLPWEFGHEYRYDFRVDGEAGGSIRFTIEPIEGEDQIEVKSRIEIEHPPRRWKANSSTRYNPSLTPIAFSFEGVEHRPDREIATGIDLVLEGGRMLVDYRQDNRLLENRTPVPPGCQIIHDNNMEQFAIFLSQIDLKPDQVTRLNVFHPRLFRAFILEIATGSWQEEAGPRELRAQLRSDYFNAELRFDERGRLLAYLRGNTEIRLAE